MSTTHTERRPSFALATVGTLVHAVLALVLLVLLVSYVPAAKKTFDEFGLTLPELTRYVIRFALWVADYWWVMAPVMLALGFADFVLLWRLSVRSRRAAATWIVAGSLLLVPPIVATAVAIEMPMKSLKEGLAK